MIPLLLQDPDLSRSTAEARLSLWGQLALADPVFLVLIPVVLALALLGARRRHAAARVPVLPAALPTSLVQRLTWLPSAMKVAALLLAVSALARPLRGSVELTRHSEGVDIALLLDRSGSMKDRGTPDAPRRFDICKRVLADFARRRMTDEAGAADNVALFGFARFTELLVPFTLDADALSGVLAEQEVEFRNGMDGTGIGVAIARAVAVFEELESQSKVIVLLTDGENNVDIIPPRVAGRLAAEEGIKVYAIFVGPLEVVRRRGLVRLPVRYDTSVLEDIARLTDGVFFHAEDETELEEVYAEIESLERREREEFRFAEQFDLYPELLLPALLLYVLSWLSVCTWARRLP